MADIALKTKVDAQELDEAIEKATAQIGEMLGGKSARTVRQMIARGDFGDTLQDGKQHLVPASGLEAYIRARTGPAEPYQRHFTGARPRRKIPEPQPLKA